MDAEWFAVISLFGMQLCLLLVAIALKEPRRALIPRSGHQGRMLGVALWSGMATALFLLGAWLA